MALGFQRQGIFGRKPMFPQNDVLSNGPYGTPGFGDSWMQRQSEMQPINSNADAMPIGVKEMTKKPGFFQKGGFGQYALAALSDFGARLNDRDQNMLGSMMAFNQKKQMEAEEARLKALEPIKLGNSIVRPDGRGGYTQVYSEPKDNDPKDQLTRYMIAAGIDPNSPRARELYARAVENEVDPVQAVPFTDAQGNSGFQYVRPSQMQGGGAAPTSKAEYDALPPGSQYRAPDGSIRTKGGSGGNVTGGFQSP